MKSIDELMGAAYKGALGKDHVLSMDHTKVSLEDFLVLWAMDGRDIDKHDNIYIFCSKDDFDSLGPVDDPADNTIIIAVDTNKLVLVRRYKGLKKNEVVLCDGGGKVFSPKLVLK